MDEQPTSCRVPERDRFALLKTAASKKPSTFYVRPSAGGFYELVHNTTQAIVLASENEAALIEARDALNVAA